MDFGLIYMSRLFLKGFGLCVIHSWFGWLKGLMCLLSRLRYCLDGFLDSGIDRLFELFLRDSNNLGIPIFNPNGYSSSSSYLDPSLIQGSRASWLIVGRYFGFLFIMLLNRLSKPAEIGSS